MGRQREYIQRSPSERALILLAGLPRSIAQGTANWLEEQIPGQPKVIAIAALERDAPLYQVPYVETCLRTATVYAERQTRTAEGAPAPSALTLAFVPAEDEDRLFSVFEFSVLPIALRGLENYEQGRQQRHIEKAAKRITLDALTRASNAAGTVQRRLNSHSTREPLFLPPRNFHVSRITTLASLFTELRKGQRSWNDKISEVQVVRASHAELPHHVGASPREFCCDHRGLFFPRDLSRHRENRELSDEATIEERAMLLRSLYRFGVPLEPGFHHDVQFAGKPLSNTYFECAVKGAIRLSSKYANVYPNDHVLPSN